MAVNRSPNGMPASAADQQRAWVRDDGLAAHPHLSALLAADGARAARDLADAVHLLCAVHGRFPGLVAVAARHCPGDDARTWLAHTETRFDVERQYLLRLTARVGPMPSTPGAAQSEASLVAAHHAIETLGMSERAGCALGAAAALVGDWRSVRLVLDRAGMRVGMDRPDIDLPDEGEIAAVVDRAAETPSSARAMAFGAQQLLLQHRALFGLLEARAEARGDF